MQSTARPVDLSISTSIPRVQRSICSVLTRVQRREESGRRRRQSREGFQWRCAVKLCPAQTSFSLVHRLFLALAQLTETPRPNLPNLANVHPAACLDPTSSKNQAPSTGTTHFYYSRSCLCILRVSFPENTDLAALTFCAPYIASAPLNWPTTAFRTTRRVIGPLELHEITFPFRKRAPLQRSIGHRLCRGAFTTCTSALGPSPFCALL